MRERFGIDDPALRFDPRPLDRESIGVESQLDDEVEVLFVAVPRVTRVAALLRRSACLRRARSATSRYWRPLLRSDTPTSRCPKRTVSGKWTSRCAMTRI